MKIRFTLLGAVALVGAGLMLQHVALAPSAVAGDDVAAVATATVPVLLAGESDAAYVGSKKCKKCHLKQHKSWKEGAKYKALETLTPGKAAEAKTKHGLDPNKDYSKDESCLKCHTTGYGHEGGYAIPDASDEQAVKKAEELAGVGCESCHGPGSGYTKLHDEIMKAKRNYTHEEMHAAGLAKLEAAVCAKCHNDTSPTFEGFDYEAKKSKGGHDNFPLKMLTE